MHYLISYQQESLSFSIWMRFCIIGNNVNISQVFQLLVYALLGKKVAQEIRRKLIDFFWLQEGSKITQLIRKLISVPMLFKSVFKRN